MSEETNPAVAPEEVISKETSVEPDVQGEEAKPKERVRKFVVPAEEEVRKKAAKPKKARRSHSKAMDGFIVDEDGSSSDEEPQKRKKKGAAELVEPDFAMPNLESVLTTIFGASDDEKLDRFSSDEERFSDLSDIDEGVVPRTKTDIKKWVTYTRKVMKAKKSGASKRGGGRGERGEVDESDILPEGTKRKKRAVADDDDDGRPIVLGDRVKKDPNRMSEEEIRVKCVEFVEKMEQAAFEDNENNIQRKPALKKLSMLEEAKQMLLRGEWQEHLTNAGVLVAATKWLSPLPDRTLPNVTIRDSIIRCLSSFQDVTKYNLKASRIASVVNFLSKNDPEPSIRKAAADLVQQWSRTLSSGAEAERRTVAPPTRLSAEAQRILSRQLGYGRPVQGQNAPNSPNAKGDGSGTPARKIHLGPQFAAQPLVSTMDYVNRPESKVDVSKLVKKSGSIRLFKPH